MSKHCACRIHALGTGELKFKYFYHAVPAVYKYAVKPDRHLPARPRGADHRAGRLSLNAQKEISYEG